MMQTTLLNERYTLANGVRIPKLAFGTSPLTQAVCKDAVITALEIGYRHLDTAAIYNNEDAVGGAVRASGLSRSELFITTKLDARIKDASQVKPALMKSLDALGMEYVDLYLIHWPKPMDEMDDDAKNYDEANAAIFTEMASLMKAGYIRAIGVSNFSPRDLKSLIAKTALVPHVNQIRYHIGHTQEDTTAFCDQADILVEAYSPLSKERFIEHETLQAIAARYGVSVAQLMLRFCIDEGRLPLPNSKTPSRIRENALLDFSIDAEDLKRLKTWTPEK